VLCTLQAKLSLRSDRGNGAIAKLERENANDITQSDFLFIHNYISLSSLESNMSMIAAGSLALGF
jgi:hypothetical protein